MEILKSNVNCSFLFFLSGEVMDKTCPIRHIKPPRKKRNAAVTTIRITVISSSAAVIIHEPNLVCRIVARGPLSRVMTPRSNIIVVTSCNTVVVVAGVVMTVMINCYGCSSDDGVY